MVNKFPTDFHRCGRCRKRYRTSSGLMRHRIKQKHEAEISEEALNVIENDKDEETNGEAEN